MMNKYDFAESVGMMHEYFIEESMKGSAQMKERIITKWSTLAAGVCLFLAAGLFAWHLSHGNVTPPPIDSLVDTTVYGTEDVTDSDTTAPQDTDGTTAPDDDTTAPESGEDKDPVDPPTENDIGTAKAISIAREAWGPYATSNYSYAIHCTSHAEDGGEKYYIVDFKVRGDRPWTHEVIVKARDGEVVSQEYHDTYNKKPTIVTSDMLRDRETIIASDIVIGNDYLREEWIIRKYAEIMYPDDAVTEVKELRGRNCSNGRREDDNVIMADITVWYYAVRYESGKTRGFMMYTVRGEGGGYVSGVEEYTGNIELDYAKTIEYIKADRRFSDLLVPQVEPSHSDGMREYIIDGAIEAAGIAGFYSSFEPIFMEYDIPDYLTDFEPTGKEGEFIFDVVAYNYFAGETDYYTVRYNALTNKAGIVDGNNTGGGDREDSDVLYDCGKFKVYYDDAGDLWLSYKKDGRTVLLSDNMSWEEVEQYIEENGVTDLEGNDGIISMVRMSGKISVFKDKKIYFSVWGYEWSYGLYIFDVDSGKMDVINGDLWFLGQWGDRLYFTPDLAGDAGRYGYTKTLYYVDLAKDSGKVIPLDIVNDFLDANGADNESVSFIISPDGRSVAISMPSRLYDTRREYAIVDIYSGQIKRYDISGTNIRGQLECFDHDMNLVIFAEVGGSFRLYVIDR